MHQRVRPRHLGSGACRHEEVRRSPRAAAPEFPSSFECNLSAKAVAIKRKGSIRVGRDGVNQLRYQLRD
jgi:hypothetical protein